MTQKIHTLARAPSLHPALYGGTQLADGLKMRSLMSVLLLASVMLVAALQMGCSLLGATIGAATGGRQGMRRGFQVGAGIDGAVLAVAAETQRFRPQDDDAPSRWLFYRCQTAKQPGEPRYYQVEYVVDALSECESYFEEQCACEER
ncbi:MAG: hypothetical protein ACI9KE_000401 [Polyangiales bacterium]